MVLNKRPCIKCYKTQKSEETFKLLSSSRSTKNLNIKTIDNRVVNAHYFYIFLQYITYIPQV